MSISVYIKSIVNKIKIRKKLTFLRSAWLGNFGDWYHRLLHSYDRIARLVLIHRTMKNITQKTHIAYIKHHAHQEHQAIHHSTKSLESDSSFLAVILSEFYDIKLYFFDFINNDWVCLFFSIYFKINIISNMFCSITSHNVSIEYSFLLNDSIHSSISNHFISFFDVFFFNSFLCFLHSLTKFLIFDSTIFSDCFVRRSYSHFYFSTETKNSNGSSSMLNIIIKHSSSSYSLIYSFAHRSFCSMYLYQIVLISYCLTLSFLNNRLINHSSLLLYRNGCVSTKWAGLWIHFSLNSSSRNSWYSSSSFLWASDCILFQNRN